MSITTIVHFEVPAENVERFYAYWQDHIKASVCKRPGLIDAILRRIDADGPYQFVNVAHWESAGQLASGLKATAAEIPVVQVFQDLGVTMSRNNYDEAVHYTASPVPARTG